MSEKAFDFVAIRELPPKPRRIGVVEIRGPYYAPVSLGYLRGILDDWGEYVDGFKFAGGSQRLLARDRVRQIIDLCHSHGVYVSTGGFIERVVLQGSGAVTSYLTECSELGFDVVEISSGLAPIPLADKVAMVRQVKKMGMKPKPEISLMMGAGAGTHIAGYEQQMTTRSTGEMIEEAVAHLDAGAEMLMMESEGITEDMPPDKWRLDVIRELVAKFGHQTWMFEAADPAVFKWYLKNISREVNVFIDHSQIVEFNAWRLGVWGDREIWQGKQSG